MKPLIPFVLVAASATAVAGTPVQILDAYANAVGAAYQVSAQRGAEFYARKFGVIAKMDSCATCHTGKPTQAGEHVITGKPIKPLAPAANADRFSDPAKVEKWFKRNCTEVVGRECSAGEKADFIAFVSGGL